MGIGCYRAGTEATLRSYLAWDGGGSRKLLVESCFGPEWGQAGGGYGLGTLSRHIHSIMLVNNQGYWREHLGNVTPM